MDKKYVVIIQCDISHRRCSGYACSNAFYNKADFFMGYEESTKYVSFTCGGCCGKAVSTKFEHFLKKIKSKESLIVDQISVHLSSCIVSDNHHFDRCPHTEYINDILLKKGVKNVIEGSYISKSAEKQREKGKYKLYKKNN